MNVIEAEKGLAKDPVCGMPVDPATAKHEAEFSGTTYYFCCAGCREKFVGDPARFVAADGGAVAPMGGRATHSHVAAPRPRRERVR